jgi:uncharacterized protein YndB with AHSA1/START domain
MSELTQVTYSDEQQPKLVDVEWELFLDAPIARVWEKTVVDFDGWWAHTYKPDSTVHIEAWPGGRIWERFADGVNGSVWANIVYIDPPFILKSVGNWAMPGASYSSGVWRFSEQDGGTLMKSSGQMLGLLDVNLMRERKGGTGTLISALKAWVEEDRRARGGEQ